MVMRKAGRTVIATLLCGSLAALTASSTALAQGRGNSGLPTGPGNPHADLQRQINSLEQQMESLGMQVDVLSSQIGQGSDQKLAVYDAFEQKVGDIVGVQENVPWVSLKVNNRTFVLQVTPHQLVGQTLWFGDSLCMGPNVYIAKMNLRDPRVGGAQVFPLAAVHSDGAVYLVEDPIMPPLEYNVGSTLSTSGICNVVPPGPNGPRTTFAIPAMPTSMNLHSLFRGPFTIR